MAAHDVEYLSRVAGQTLTIVSADMDHGLDRLHHQGLARLVERPWVDGRPRVKVVLTPAGREALARAEVL
jgi:hypothetical protein